MISTGKFDDFKTTTLVRRLNLWFQIFLGVTLFCGLNYLASRHFCKWDFSETQKNSLSPESAAYVKNLTAHVEIFVIWSQSSKDNDEQHLQRYLKSILDQYKYISGNKNTIEVKYINSHIENKRLESLVPRFGKDLENCVIVASGKRFKRIPIKDFYNVEAGERFDFKGEQLLTSAILNVISNKTNKIYFVKGHGELKINDSRSSYGLSEFVNAMTLRDYKVEEINLEESKQVPEDADIVIVAGAQITFLPREILALRDYLLKRNGKVVLFLGMGSLCGLDDVMYDWGLMSDDMLVMDNSGDYESSAGDLIARTLPQKPHPIVSYLVNYDMPVQFSTVRPVRADLGAPIDGNLKLSEIIISGASSWAEKSYKDQNITAHSYDERTDLKGMQPLAMVASRTGGNDLGLNIPGGKLVVFGDENFIINKWFNRLGNSKLALNTIDWLLDDNTMLDIAPRKIDKYMLTLSQNQINALGWRFMILPAVILLLGLIVSLTRRR